MSGMLEGKEIEGKIGEVGSYYVDVSKEGSVKIGVLIEAKLVEEDVTVKSDTYAEAHILTILKKIAEKNNKPFLATSADAIKNILGMVG